MIILSRYARLLLVTRIIYRVLKISPNTARKAALALEREGMLQHVFREPSE